MVAVVKLAQETVCSPQQKELLSKFCSSEHPKADFPTYCMKWQLSSSFTSYDRIAYTWQAVSSHHPILRTSITLKDDTFDFDVRDRASRMLIKAIDEEVGERRGVAIAELSVCVDDTIVSLRLRIQQALIDRPSLACIRHDFQLFYDGLACGPQNPFKYYVSHIRCRDQERALSFWRELMSEAVTSLTYGIPKGLKEKQRSYHRAISLELLKDLQLFFKAYEVSPAQLVHAMWALVQYRHTAATDGKVIFAVSGKDTTVPECNTYVGLTEQQYPIRLQLQTHLPALDWIFEVSRVNQEAASNAFVGYERIASEVLPLEVQVQLLLGDGMDIVEEGYGRPSFPLVINFDPTNGSIMATYNSDTDKNDDLIFLIGHLITAIKAVVKDPRTPVEQIQIISKDEQAVLTSHSEPLTPQVPDLVHRLVERQVEFTPDYEAINFEGQSSLTYAELNKLANQVARQLNIQRGDHVAVSMDRSPSLIISLLAILKRGAAYVVLDPESPQDRSDFIVSDVNSPMVLTDNDLVHKFANSVSVDQLIENASQFEDTNLHVRQHPSEIVYVIYTSGSTGRPKGVLLEHQAATTGLEPFPKLPDLRQLLFHNPVFSAAQRSIWSTLKQGGCLCLARKEQLTTRISDMICRMDVNVIDVTPSTASLIDPETVPTLKRLTVAGELINPALLPVWMDRVELLNAYGLSENTQINWRHPMRPDQNPQNIGRPVDSTRSYVLIPGTTQQAAILEPGELCLGGHQLARSYLNRPEKTNEAFLQNPFGPGRIYRTGDMVVTHSDGSIEMIGRIDFQAKINGQRVEPGETNYYIQKHAGVFDSCTVAAIVAGKRSLVAVVVPKDRPTWPLLSRKLQQLLRQRLPSYMVPSYWLSVSQLPLNVNGKVDVPQVARMVESSPREDLLLRSLSQRKDDKQSSLTRAEGLMRATWSEVLKIPVEQISLDDSFLDLGGSSLEAVMVTASARARMIEVKAQEVLIQENLRGLAHISRKMAVPLEQATIQPFSLLPKGTSLDYSSLANAWPVTPAQEPLIADLILGGTQYVYNRIIRLKKQSINSFKAAFTDLYMRNAFLRSTFVEHGNTYLQLIRTPTDIPWKVSSKTLTKFLESEEPRKIALGEPFCRVVETKSGELVLTFHHAMFDHWSSQFFYEDLTAIMNLKPLGERPLYDQYVKFVSQQDGSRSRQFWKTYLQGAQPSVLRGPHSRMPEMVEHNTGIDLHNMTKDLGIPAGSLICAAWAIALSAEIDTKDVVFAVTIAGRDIPVPDVLRMYGPTVTNVPIRVQLEDIMTLREVSKAIQAQVLKVSEHAYWGLRAILRASGNNSSLFNTSVNFIFRPESEVGVDFDFSDQPSSHVSDILKMEVDSQDTKMVSLTSTLGNDASHSLLEKVAEVFKIIHKHPDTAIGEVLSEPRHGSPHRNDSAEVDASHFRLAHSLFEYRAVTHSSKIAVTDEFGKELTYQQLNEKANQLAAFLHSMGTKPEVVIPLYLDKSINTIVSMLGIWKAGGAFCALDPANPFERNSLIIKDLGATTMITDKANTTEAKTLGIEALVIDEVALDSFDSENPVSKELASENLAYILYTSGSTGKPKGVMITHGSVAAASQGIIEGLLYADDWRMLWALNYTFDGSYFDVFPLLGVGGTLCIVRQQVVFSDLAGYINRLKATHLNVTPTIASTITPDEVPQLKFLILGGEPLHPGILKVWASRVQVQNNYGPTEGTVMVTTATVRPDSALNYIGRALPSAELSVRELDSRVKALNGEVGELCISGSHVARGYLNRPEATKSAFFTDDNGQVIYRTGDLARLLPNGGYELCGRKDDQVKVNGYRIELGEIESAIQYTDIVQSCVVIAPNVHQKKQLVACCKLASSAGEAAGERSSLMLDASALVNVKDLPSMLVSLAHYMIPAIWVPFREFPRLTSGKIDRKSLSSLVEAMDACLLTKFPASYVRGQL